LPHRFLVDTNVYLRLTSPEHPHHVAASRAMHWLIDGGHTICFTLQTASEFWNGCTRPAQFNGLNYSVEQAEHHLALIEAAGTLLPDGDDVYAAWRRLVRDYQVRGARVHDAKLVASMVAHSVPSIITLNTADFRRYREIETVSPDAL
jgi:predicted nucleic acid-binding protein